MSTIAGNFASDYQDARQKFCAAAAAGGGAFRSYRHPMLGPDGGRLFLDTARFGDDDAPHMLVLQAATHGVEGFCGSGIMVNWLRSGGPATLPKGTGALLIHGVNPYGFAWIRRVNEDNVDLNRNFVDHAKPYPPNDGYPEVADAVLPQSWDEQSLAEAQRVFEAYAKAHSELDLAKALTQGQYTHPDGIFFGGNKQTWSNRTVRSVIRTELGRASRIGLLDVHTGIGPSGVGYLISTDSPTKPSYARLKAWYGEELTSTQDGSSGSAEVTGTILDAFPQEAPDAECSCVALEYGTHPPIEVIEACRRDNWLHQRGDLNSPLGKEMKAYVRERFYPADPKWAEMVWASAQEVIAMAVRGLNS
ncbi:MAG: DUF2817 domain-containing protein [Deltaproteobacteria bacterium]|nr:DUF2817 domain-containing protein [Deltaproteobacteria bacterium]